jgi:phospholipid transport system substrate-binding protein
MANKPRRSCGQIAFAVLACCGLYSLTNAQTETPEDVVRGAAESVLRSMEDRRDYLQEHPAELRQLVNSIFSPRFDQNYAAYLVLGRHGREANAEQRSRFTAALYSYILNRYTHGLLSFTSDRLQIIPYPGSEGDERATVRTFVILNDGRRIPVNYDLRLGTEGWLVYDIAIDGISYVRNLRSQLGAEIEQAGLEHVIERLEGYRTDAEDDPA